MRIFGFDAMGNEVLIQKIEIAHHRIVYMVGSFLCRAGCSLGRVRFHDGAWLNCYKTR